MTNTGTESHEAIWHDVECGGYSADLPTWSQLASEAAGPVLELGAGTGRVALHLAGEGFEVTALERSEPLLAALAERAAARGLALETVHADARELDAGREFALVLAPMQLAHLLGGSDGRRRTLERSAAALRPAGMLALAVLGDDVLTPAAGPPPLPDVREVDGWIFSSQPIEVRKDADGIELRRLRQLVAPGGELTESLDAVRLDRLSPSELETEAVACGLEARERIEIAATDDHVGSTVIVLEVPR